MQNKQNRSSKYQEYLDHRTKNILNWLYVAIMIIFLVIWSWLQSGIEFLSLVRGMVNIYYFVADDLLLPNYKIFGAYLMPVFETLYMSFLGLVLAIGFSLFLGFMSAGNTTFHPGIAFISRSIVSFLRAVPSLVIGIFFVATFGIGTFAGILALGLSGIGILGKAYAESIEEADKGQLEAIRATGASWLQVIGQGVWPQFKPSFVSWTFYKMDTNIRDAAIIGLIGAGGIGYKLQGSIKLFQYKDAAFGILMIFLLIITVEYLTAKIREKVL